MVLESFGCRYYGNTTFTVHPTVKPTELMAPIVAWQQQPEDDVHKDDEGCSMMKMMLIVEMKRKNGFQ